MTDREITLQLLHRLMNAFLDNPTAQYAISEAIMAFEKIKHEEINAEYQKRMREERL